MSVKRLNSLIGLVVGFVMALSSCCSVVAGFPLSFVDLDVSLQFMLWNSFSVVDPIPINLSDRFFF